MDAHARRLVGWVIVAAGAVIAGVGALADQIGLGGEGPDKFAGKQVAAVVVGLIVAAVGLLVALWPARPPGRSTAGPADR